MGREKIQKLRRYVFTVLLVLLPSQLGWHFWPGWAVINGIRVDYFSPTLYLTDFLILGLFILWAGEKFTGTNRRDKGEERRKDFKSISLVFAIFFFLFYALFNVYFSLSPAVSLYQWLKVAEMGFLVWWIVQNAQLLCYSYKILLVPVFYESFLAIWQFLNQSSIGGLWYWLGERTFNSGTPGIANAFINGSLVLRPYGTFSHPNVLGGFLAVVLPFILAHFLHNYRKLTALVFGESFVLFLGYMTLFLSMSREAIIVGILVTLWLVRQKIWLVVVLLLGLAAAAPRFWALGTETETIVARLQLDSAAVSEFVHSPLIGTGLGTAPLYVAISKFRIPISNYALAFQPTHNIYLLAMAEIGIWGLLAWGLLGWWAWKKRSVPLLSILVLGLTDHYFLTLQQGQLLLSLTIALTLVRMEKRKTGGGD